MGAVDVGAHAPTRSVDPSADSIDDVEHTLAAALASVMELPRVATDRDYFDDLGADSLTMAHFCARLANTTDLPPLSIKDVYSHRTIGELAATLTAAPNDSPVARVDDPATTATHRRDDPTPVGRAGYLLCGALQGILLVSLAILTGAVVAVGYEWVTATPGWAERYVRSLLFGVATFLTFAVVPIALKWLLVGRWTSRTIRIWSLDYVRFWFVKLIVQGNPLALFAGSPIYVLYLRALGARIGRGTVILSPGVPVCTDLVTIGDRAVVRSDVLMPTYRATGSIIETGPVTIGSDAFVGEATTLEIHSRIGDRAQLGHSSALHAGQSIPDDERRIGSPAVTPTDADYRASPRPDRVTRHRVTYSMAQVAILAAISLPAALLVPLVIAEHRVWSAAFDSAAAAPLANDAFYTDTLLLALALFAGVPLARLLLALTVPRVLNRFFDAGTAYPIYTFRFGMHRAIARYTNIRFFTNLLGDTSYILGYVRRLGYDISPAGQTGANFGLNVAHASPYHVSIGTGTMAADGLSVVNSDYSSTSFSVSHARIGDHSFLGNNVAYPAAGRTGDNCLHATKLQVPVTGPERTDVGFLGSPSFEIPRLVRRDREFAELKSRVGENPKLGAKNRHNLVTIAMYLVSRWVAVVLALAFAWWAVYVYARFGWVTVGGSLIAAGVVLSGYLVLVERASLLFRRLRPTQCSMYERPSWMVERYWKLSWQPLLLNGTPFKGLMWRLMGVKVGARLFDDGCLIIDKTLVSIGDDCAFNTRSAIQPHSQEDGGFKSDSVTLGSGVTLGVRSLVHYGTTVGDHVSIAADSFLMKGTEAPSGSTWGENPARQLSTSAASTASTTASPTSTTASPTSTSPPAPRPLTTPEPTTTHDPRQRPRPEDVKETTMDTDIDVDHAHWRSVLETGGRTVLPRWSSCPHPGVARYEVAASRDLADALNALAADMKVPVGAFVLAAHARVLASLSGEPDIATGLIVEPGGPPLPCRISAETSSWRELVTRCVRVESEMRPHRNAPLDDIARDVGLTEPIFETVFDRFDPTAELDDDVALRVCIAPNGHLHFLSRTDSFDAGCIERIAGYHLTALQSIVADPDADPTGRTLLDDHELELQLTGLDGPHRDLPDHLVHELFEQRVRIHPDAVAATHLHRQWTYRELNSRANQLARALQARRVRPSQVVAVVTERNLDWMASVLAIFKIGAIYLPIEPHFPAERIARTLARAGCTTVMTEPGSTGSLYEALDSLCGVTGFFIDHAYEAGHADHDLGLHVGANQVAYIYFTSGSTGEPKGAMCEHAGMLNHLFAKIDDFGIREGDTVAQVAPQCFDISLWQLVSALLVGGRTLIVDQATILDPPAFIDVVADEGTAIVQVVPSYLEVLLSYLEHHPIDLPALRCVSVTGEALSYELVQRFFATLPAVKLANAYGLTETSDDTNHEVMDRAPADGSVPLGPAVRNVHVRVVDDHLRPVPLGAPGEIVFAGVCVGRGYINDPDRTAAAFMDDPLRPGDRLYRSGDFGRWRPDGKLEYLGRRDAQVKIRGFRIEIGEIENALLQLPGVRQSAVVVTERPDGSKQLVAFYSGTETEAIDIQRGVGESLPDYMVPSVVHWRENLPLTGNGKTDKKTLTRLAGEIDAEPTGFEDPQTPTERELATVWARVLGLPVERIGRFDNFFDRGGSSLSAVEMVLELSSDISLADVTSTPVLADLAIAITGGVPRVPSVLQPLTRVDDLHAPSLICFPAAGGNAVNFHAVARALADDGLAVYAVEYPGHDLTSDEPFAPLHEVVEQVIDAATTIGLRRVTLWGHSSGAAYAIETARQLSRSGVGVDRIFIGAQLLGSAAERLAHVEELGSRNDVDIAAALARSGEYADLGRLDDGRGERVGAAYRHDCVQAHAYLSAMIAAPPPVRLAVPVTVVVAADDPLTDGTIHDRSDWSKLFDAVDVHELSDGGHSFQRTNPGAVADLIRSVTDVSPGPSTPPAAAPIERDPVTVVPIATAANATIPTPTVPMTTSPAPNGSSERPARTVRSSTDDIDPGDGQVPLVHADPVRNARAWVAEHADEIHGVVAEHGVALVRGLDVDDDTAASSLLLGLSDRLMVEREAFGTRQTVSGGTYSATEWPPNQQMCMHHESSYTLEVPELMLFAHLTAPTSGGVVSVADAGYVLDALPADIVDRFEVEGWTLVRNYTEEIGLSVDEAFGTSDRTEIEEYCHANAIDLDWQPGGGLRTQQRRPAVTRHPGTGRRCWFNQIAFLNEWTMKPEVRDFLVGLYGVDGLPFTTRFGGGDPIGPDVVQAINDTYDAHSIPIHWEPGDLLLIDNIRMAHSRAPFEGERRVLAALANPTRLNSELSTEPAQAD